MKKKYKPYDETHFQGLIFYEKNIQSGVVEGDIGVQVAKDGRVWICVDGQSLIRFTPSSIGGGMKQILDALDRFEESVKERAWIGSKHPNDMDSIEEEYQEAKSELLKLLRKKCK